MTINPPISSANTYHMKSVQGHGDMVENDRITLVGYWNFNNFRNPIKINKINNKFRIVQRFHFRYPYVNEIEPTY